MLFYNYYIISVTQMIKPLNILALFRVIYAYVLDKGLKHALLCRDIVQSMETLIYYGY